VALEADMPRFSISAALAAALVLSMVMGGPAVAQDIVGKYDATPSFDGFKTELEITAVHGSSVNGKAGGQAMSGGVYSDYTYTLGSRAAGNEAQAYIAADGTLVVKFPSGSYYTLRISGPNLTGSYTSPEAPHKNKARVTFSRTS